MYSLEAKNIIINRIKWRTPFGEYAYILEDDVKASLESKTYQDAHRIVTIKNIHLSQEYKDITEIDFNKYLRSLNVICVNRVLEDVFDNNIRAIRGCDYSGLLESNISIFDKALKIYMAVIVGELIITSKRISLDENVLGTSYEKIKVEVEGAKNESGKVIAVGLKTMYNNAIKEIINILFPRENSAVIHNVEMW